MNTPNHIVSPIPRDKGVDSAFAVAREGYRFITKRCRQLGSDVFQTRILLQKFIFMTGEEAARLFYDQDRFERKDAAPRRAKRTLFGECGVQGMDGAAHRWRKEMFMALMTPERIKELANLTLGQWHAYATKWEALDRIILFDQTQEILCRAVCEWAGVPLSETEVKERTGDLALMIDGSGGIGLRHWRGIWARQRTEKWIGDLVGRLRAGEFHSADGTAMQTIAQHRDLTGKPLDLEVAAVEVINVLRPTVAVARYATFAALALHEHPQWLEKLRASFDDYAELFVQEVRRFYPFFPAVAARVRREFEWHGHRFPKGRRVVLDLYGTNHDERSWDKPDEFQPERFRRWNGSPFNFIPQGGGDHHHNHRCPGEWITIELMKVALRFLAGEIQYDVPEQDLRVSLRRIPAMPESRFLISNVKA